VLQAGDAVQLIERRHPEWTIARACDAARERAGSAALALANVSALSARWKAWLRGEPARV
jgi:MOSC domain-containing protein YiiM